MSLKHDDLYARAWEYDYDAEDNTPLPPNVTEIPVQSNVSIEQTRNTPRTAHECPSEVFHHTEELCDVTDTYTDMQHDVETNSEQSNNSPTNPRSSKYNLRHNPKPNCKDDYRY